MHQRTRWDMARLRLLGRVLSTAMPATAASDSSGDAGCPSYAVLRGLKTAHDVNEGPPQRWNWYTTTVATLEAVDAGAPAEVQLRSRLSCDSSARPASTVKGALQRRG
jgi:hypothetical protein